MGIRFQRFFIFFFFLTFSQVGSTQTPFSFWKNRAPVCSAEYGPDISVDGPVRTVFALGGTTFIAGNFTTVNGVPRTNFAALTSNGSVTALNPLFQGTVHAMDSDGSVLFAGGNFASVGSLATTMKGGILDSSGSLVSQVQADGIIYSSESDGNGGWYLGGAFTTLQGQSRNRLGQVDANGILTSWNPDASNTVYSLHRSGGTLFVGGDFTVLSGQQRSRIGAFTVNDGNITPWNPGLSDTVRSIVSNAGTVFVGGDFTSSNPFFSSFAKITTSGTVDTNTPITNGTINAAISDGAGGWYIGGRFSQVAGQSRQNLARINSDNSVNPWNPTANNTVYSLALHNGTLFAGGVFTSIGGASRDNLAALRTDIPSGDATSWDPSPGGIINTILVQNGGGTVFAGGIFTSTGTPVGGNTFISDFAGNVLVNLGTINSIFAVEPDGSGGWYLGGNFSTVLGQPRRMLAQIDSSGNLTSWDPATIVVGGDFVTALHLDGTLLYVGGDFTVIGSSAREDLAVVRTTDGVVSPWRVPFSSFNGSIYDITTLGDMVYVAGTFGQSISYANNVGFYDPAGDYLSTTPAVGNSGNENSAILPDDTGGAFYSGVIFNIVDSTGTSSVRNSVARINGNGTVHPFTAPLGLGRATAMAQFGGTLFVGAGRGTLGGVEFHHLAALNSNTGSLGNWSMGTSGTVSALKVVGDKLVVGGDFRTVGDLRYTHAGEFSVSNGSLNLNFPVMPGQDVRTVIPDGAGGWIIGGSFTTIGTIARNRIARINQDGTVHPWDPNSNNIVYSLARFGGTVFVGGSFGTIGGASRRALAAIRLDLDTNNATNWNANVIGSQVQALDISGGTLFVGGTFGTIGGQVRRNFASLLVDVDSNQATTWGTTMNAGSYVKAIRATDTKVFIGGLFTTVGASARQNLAGLDRVTTAVDGTSTTFSGGSEILALAPVGSLVFVGGNFSLVGGAGIAGLAAVNVNGTAVTSWRPFPTGGNYVNAIAESNGTLFIAGNYDSPSDFWDSSLAGIEAQTASVTFTNFEAPISNRLSASQPWAYAVSYQDGRVFVGTDPIYPAYMGGRFSPGLAAFSLTSPEGGLTSWKPIANNRVRAFETVGTVLYVGGDFGSMGVSLRQRLAAFGDSLTDDNPLEWHPRVVGTSVNVLKANGTLMYIGGNFTQVGGVNVQDLAAAPLTGTLAVAFNPSAVGPQVNDLSISNGTLYVAGSFGSLGGIPITNYGAWNLANNQVVDFNLGSIGEFVGVHATSGTIFTLQRLYGGLLEFVPMGAAAFKKDQISINGTTWRPEFTSPSLALTVATSGTMVYVGGAFQLVDGISRPKLAAVNSTTGSLSSWTASPTLGTVHALTVVGSDIFVGGSYGILGGTPRAGVAKVSLLSDTGNISSWDAQGGLGSMVYEMSYSSGTLFVSGDFGIFGNKPRGYLAALQATGTTATATVWNVDGSGVSGAIAPSGAKVLAHSSGSSFGGKVRNRIAGFTLSPDTNNATDLYVDITGTSVRALAQYGNFLFVGGAFTLANNLSRNPMFQVDLTTGTLGSWNPSGSGTVHSLLMTGSTLFVGGSFGTMASSGSYVGLASFDFPAGTVRAWNPRLGSVTDDIYALTSIGTIVYLAGDFTTVSGVSRENLAAVGSGGTLALPWNPRSYEPMVAISTNGTVLAVGGVSSLLGGIGAASTNYLAGFNRWTDTLNLIPFNSFNASLDVRSISLDSNELVVAGFFGTIGGQPRSRLANIDIATDSVTSWNPAVNGVINSVTKSGSTVFVGGTFGTIGGQLRNRLAKILTTGTAALAWDPAISSNGTVNSVLVGGSTLLVAGHFSSINSQRRQAVAVFDTEALSNNLVSTFDTYATPLAHTVSRSSDQIFIGGDFTSIGGRNRRNLAAIDLSTGQLTNWNPEVSGRVDAMTLTGSTLYVSGAFLSSAGPTGGKLRSTIAQLNTGSNYFSSATDWAPIVTGSSIGVLVPQGTLLYVGGVFTQVNGVTRNSAAALDTIGTAGAAVSFFNPNITGGAVRAMVVDGTTVYFGGTFTTTLGNGRNKLSMVTYGTAQALMPWNPNVTGNVFDLELTPDELVVAGNFSLIGGTSRQHLAALRTSGTSGLTKSFNPGPSAEVLGITYNNGTLSIGGQFISVGGSSNRIRFTTTNICSP